MIENIQVLRAFAAINVVYFHVLVTARNYGQPVEALSFLEGWGANGVDIFFVISGFVMLHTQRRRRRPIRAFMVARFVRIVPIYWIMALAVVVLFTLAPGIFRSFTVTPTSTLSSLLFMSRLAGEPFPIVYPGWTLEWEMLFYLVFAAAMFLRGWVAVALATAAMLAAAAAIFGNLIVLEFLLGMGIAAIPARHAAGPRAGIAVAAAGALLLAASLLVPGLAGEADRLLIWGVPAALVVCGAIQAPQLRSPWLGYLGDASYSIYLIQVLSIPGIYKAMALLPDIAGPDAITAICLVASVAAGCLLHAWVEKPVTRMIVARLADRDRARAQPA